MEVHHHSHTSDPPDSYRDHRGRKKWTHYFWEFLMLFLAVFCGFLAENLREHEIEKRRERVFMKNMLEDLKADTAAYQQYARNNRVAFMTIDSLVYLLKSPERNKRMSRIYYLARTLTMRTDILIANRRTYDEMKSSGQLRLIHNSKVSDSASNYYSLLEQINTQNERVKDRGNYYMLSMSDLFDADILLEIFKQKKEPEEQTLKLLTEDTKVINELLTRAQYLYGTFSFVESYGIRSCRRAESLIGMIKKEYDLK